VGLPPNEEEPRTILEDLVGDAAPTRSKKRRQELGSVQGLDQTRTVILGKARTVLQTQRLHEAVEVPQTQAFGLSKLKTTSLHSPKLSETTYPQTQLMGKSNVAELLEPLELPKSRLGGKFIIQSGTPAAQSDIALGLDPRNVASRRSLDSF